VSVQLEYSRAPEPAGEPPDRGYGADWDTGCIDGRWYGFRWRDRHPVILGAPAREDLEALIRAAR
jgi:hypothetical protein